MGVLALRLFALVVVASMLAVAPVYADVAHQIVPAQGIGPVQLGGSAQSAIAVLGPPKSTTNTVKEGAPALLYRWFATNAAGAPTADASGFAVTTLPDGTITQVSIRNSPAYETADHLHTGGPTGARGSFVLDIRRRMGEPSTIAHSDGARGFEYIAGIRFWFDSSNRVVQIDVF